MTPYKVEFEVLLPGDLRDEDVVEWLEFELRLETWVSYRNPLAGHVMRAEPNTVQADKIEEG